MYMVYVWIILNDRVIFIFCEIVDLNIRQLLFNTPHHRSCKDNIANRAEAYDENLFQLRGLFAAAQK